MPRIIAPHGQPPRLLIWNGETDLSFDLSDGELRNIVTDGFEILMRRMRAQERKS